MKKQENENIGQTIRVLRTAAGMKQKELAIAAGIQPNSLSLIESGKREPSLSLLRSIARALDVPMSLIFREPQDYSKQENDKQTTLLRNLRQQLLELESLRLSECALTHTKKSDSR
jgi:transcriptional regulator with XRE-family HTH domain